MGGGERSNEMVEGFAGGRVAPGAGTGLVMTGRGVFSGSLVVMVDEVVSLIRKR